MCRSSQHHIELSHLPRSESAARRCERGRISQAHSWIAATYSRLCLERDNAAGQAVPKNLVGSVSKPLLATSEVFSRSTRMTQGEFRDSNEMSNKGRSRPPTQCQGVS